MPLICGEKPRKSDYPERVITQKEWLPRKSDYQERVITKHDSFSLLHEAWDIISEEWNSSSALVYGVNSIRLPKIPYIMMWQYWLGNTKPKKAFILILNAFKKLLLNLKNNNFLTEFSTD